MNLTKAKEEINKLFIWDDGIRLNGKTAFKFFSVYGFPPEMFEEEGNRLFEDKFHPFSVEKALLICIVYDKRYGTNYLEKFLNINSRQK